GGAWSNPVRMAASWLPPLVFSEDCQPFAQQPPEFLWACLGMRVLKSGQGQLSGQFVQLKEPSKLACHLLRVQSRGCIRTVGVTHGFSFLGTASRLSSALPVVA